MFKYIYNKFGKKFCRFSRFVDFWNSINGVRWWGQETKEGDQTCRLCRFIVFYKESNGAYWWNQDAVKCDKNVKKINCTRICTSLDENSVDCGEFSVVSICRFL